MARSTIAVAKPDPIGSDAIVVGTLIASDASGAGGYKLIAETKEDRFSILVTNKGATGLMRVVASDFATLKGQGDTTHIVGGGSALAPGSSVITVVGARCRQATGDIFLDSGVDGTAYAMQI